MWLQGKNMFHRYNPLVGWHIMAAMSRWHHLLEVHLWSGVVWLNPNVSFHSKFKGFFPPFLYTFFWWVSFHSKCWLVSFHSKLNHILILFFPNIGVIEHEIYPELWQCRKNTISHRIWGYTLFLDEPICMVPRACAYPFSSRGPSRSPLV